MRAALAIRDFAVEHGIELRIGVTTGEALVNFDARPDRGETMATGDVVNTAARLQSAAPVNGILVSEQTNEATKDAIEYAEAEPVEAKGKAQRVPVWQALSAAPLQERAHTTPLVGRERELGKLRDALAGAQEERAPQHVTLVGEPGIGKSRLVYEIFQCNGDVVWRKGRCLPYGDGVAFWALGEIVKAQLGILESDSTERAEEKLVATVEDPWVAGHLRTLVGIGEERESLGDRRAEAFAAWRRFLTTLAEERPLALVLEDVHWADDGLLDFVDSPRGVGAGVSAARPLHGPAGAARAPARVGSDSHPALPALRRRDRTPAFLLDPDRRVRGPRRANGRQPPLCRAIRAAARRGRLSRATPHERAWHHRRSPRRPACGREGAAAGHCRYRRGVLERRRSDARRGRPLGDRGAPARARAASARSPGTLLLCRRRDRVRLPLTSSYGDVAYSEIPRTERAAKHGLAADWIESLGRSDDRAELLAHHFLAALEYAGAAGADSADVSARARLALRKAGERALALSAFAAAVRYYRAALELWPADDNERPYLLLRYGTALRWAEDRGENELAEARHLLAAAGDPGTAAEAEIMLADITVSSGQLERAAEHLDHASSLVSGPESHGRRPTSSAISPAFT